MRAHLACAGRERLRLCSLAIDAEDPKELCSEFGVGFLDGQKTSLGSRSVHMSGTPKRERLLTEERV